MGIQVVNEPPPEDNDSSGRGVTRRDALTTGGVAFGALAGGSLLAACGGSASSSSSGSASGGSSSGGAQKLRVIGIGVDQNPALKAQAKKDLNIDLEYTITDTPTTTQKSITQPQNFDVGHLYVHQIPQLLPAGVTQPVDTSKIPGWTGGTTAVERAVGPAHEPVGVDARLPGPEAGSRRRARADAGQAHRSGHLRGRRRRLPDAAAGHQRPVEADRRRLRSTRPPHRRSRPRRC